VTSCKRIEPAAVGAVTVFIPAFDAFQRFTGLELAALETKEDCGKKMVVNKIALMQVLRRLTASLKKDRKALNFLMLLRVLSRTGKSP